MNTSSIALVVVTERLGPENAAYSAVQNFIDVCDDEVDDITIIGPATIKINRDNVNQVPIQRRQSTGILSQLVDYIHYQFQIAYELQKRKNQYKAVFFHIGGSMLFIPLLFCKLSRLYSVIFITGSTKQSYYANHGRNRFIDTLARAITLVESVTCCLSDDIITLSDNMRSPWTPECISTNILSMNFNYIDCLEFEKKTKINDRDYDIIFLGRFESVKGVNNLIKSVPLLVEKYPQIKIKLIGDGELRDHLEDVVAQQGVSEHISFTGWVDHEKIPDHLNEGRVLLMPSESEGVPKTILEAMACGTIPVATPVGGIPDIITDGKNGFLLPDTDPITIAEVVSFVLDQNDLEQISDQARCSIEENHSYEVTREKYRKILYKIAN